MANHSSLDQAVDQHAAEYLAARDAHERRSRTVDRLEKPLRKVLEQAGEALARHGIHADVGDDDLRLTFGKRQFRQATIAIDEGSDAYLFVTCRVIDRGAEPRELFALRLDPRSLVEGERERAQLEPVVAAIAECLARALAI